jgi:molybdopterin molybdotransferase
MPSYQKALEIILENIHAMEIEEKPVYKSVGQVLAEDIYSDYDLPQSDTSGPDGYAVQADDIKDAGKDNPVTLRIIETVRAGHLPENSVTPGTAIRIMTGAVLPQGADCVVRFEDTDEPPDKNGPNRSNPSEVKIYVSMIPGTNRTNIGKAGHNIAQGSLVLSKGKVIGPAQVSILNLIGKSNIRVIRRPVVAILSTGDELISQGNPLLPGKTYDCNGPAIATLVEHYGGTARLLGIARDEEESLLSSIRSAAHADAIIMSGGVSKGDYDLSRIVVGKLGEVKFSRVDIVPGAAVAFGLVNISSDKSQSSPVPIFALAGPPAGCLVDFETLVRPALLKMQGYSVLSHPSVAAIVPDAIQGRQKVSIKWTDVKKINGEYHVELNKIGMPKANSLTLIPEGAVVQAGEKIQVWPLDWCRDYQDNF